MRGGCDVDSAARAYFNGWLNLCLFRDELFKDIVNISLRSGEELRSIGACHRAAFLREIRDANH